MRNKVIARPRTLVILSVGNFEARISISLRPSQKWEVFTVDKHKTVVNGKTKLYMSNKKFDELFQMEG